MQKAKEKVVKEKKSIADERAHERAEASKQKAEEKELEHQRKVELVRQIKCAPSPQINTGRNENYGNKSVVVGSAGQ